MKKEDFNKYILIGAAALLLGLFIRGCKIRNYSEFKAVKISDAQPELSRRLGEAYTEIQRLQHALDSVVAVGTPHDWYVMKYADAARETQRKHGVPACITLAQGLLESDAGRSRLAKDHNNHFGIKCFSKKCRAGHCTNLSDDHHKDFFRCFSSVWEAFEAHAEFLQKPHYKKRTKGLKPNQWRQYAKAIHAAGYATDPEYSDKLIRIVKKYNLEQYNK